MAEQRTVQVARQVDATPEAVFRALTHALDLAFWFCHSAWSEPQPGGSFLARWNNGWWARGVFRAVERPRRVELIWQGRDEPGETDLTFQVDALDEGTMITIVHSGFGGDVIWDKAVAEAEKSWPMALDNLASVLTTGVDRRVSSRPMLGVFPVEMTPELADREGIKADSGIFLADVVAGGAAAEAGLQRGDVLVSIEGLALMDPGALTTTLARHRAGDRIRVSFVRRDDLREVGVILKPRPIVEISFDPGQVVEQAHELQRSVMDRLREALGELTEAEAGTRPAPDEWSVKEILAHLSISERAIQRWIAGIIAGETAGQYGDSSTALPEVVAMTLTAAPGLDALLDRIEQDMEETLALFGALRPEIVAMRARYRAMAESLLATYHADSHLNQIRATIEAVRG